MSRRSTVARAWLAGVAGVTLSLAVVLGMGHRDAASATAAESSNQGPPPIVLKSEAGRQRAVQGSYCVAVATETGGVVGCGDMEDPEPRHLSVVRPHERVEIRVRGATTARGIAAVHPRGCDRRTVMRIKIARPVKRWAVRLEPGRYELEVFIGDFATPDGRVGDTSGALGLLVSKNRPQDVIPAGDSLACA